MRGMGCQGACHCPCVLPKAEMRPLRPKRPETLWTMSEGRTTKQCIILLPDTPRLSACPVAHWENEMSWRGLS